MIRNLKALGPALGAVFALGALMASSASAVDTLTTPQATAIVTATGTNAEFFITNPFNVRVQCTTTTLAGTVKNGTSVNTFEATYTGTLKATPHSGSHCTGVGGVGGLINQATVNMNGCDYNITGNTTGKDITDATKGTVPDAKVWVTCPAGKHIIIETNIGCTLTIPEQTPTEGGVTYTNETVGGKKQVTVHETITGITYTTDGFACTWLELPSEGNNSDYTGTVVAKAFEHKGVATKHPFTEGAQVDLESSTS
jgi:hypothetical protein